MKEVRLIRVEKTYPAAGQRHAVHAVRGVDLTIAPGEFFVLLGASGSGKTTLLRCIAGLEETTGGEISIGDTVVASARHTVPALKRNIGMVFQDYAIWPHMAVAENVGFALRHARSGAMRGEAARTRVAEVLDVVGLSTMADRGATYLSGGQQQRVALARAVVAKPDVLLFDEPLSNLDARLRSLMRTELRRIATELGITSVYVTHDQVEALVMADHIAVMKDGLVVQVGTPQEIYRQPNNTFVAGFIGEANLV
ncbi:MAG: Fe(3+) ions import ATP-binding protein FbpC, partial [Pseudonocardiales bacterium]|nr:Fe(3+) ions import ATP-binding protein FbpC [Pseudonocardiales bacterium]